MNGFLARDLGSLKRVLFSVGPVLEKTFETALKMMVDCLRRGGKILACGNGGSAADAEHLVGELIGRFAFDRDSLPAVSLTCPIPVLTAIGNDYGYDQVFRRPLEGLGRPGDVLIGISTSGKSPNVVNALICARQKGIGTIAMTGERDSPMAEAAEVTLRAPSAFTPRIQEIHALLIHSLCCGVEESFFPEKARPGLPAGKIVAEEKVAALAALLPAFRSVFTNGCFDLLHPGHVSLLRWSRSQGDLLIVGLNTDDSVRRLKGHGRPVHSLEDRATVLAALEPVDFIVPFDEDTPLELIRKLTPRVLVKGGDYTRDTIVGADWVESHGGSVMVFPLVAGHSSTGILQRHGK